MNYYSTYAREIQCVDCVVQIIIFIDISLPADNRGLVWNTLPLKSVSFCDSVLLYVESILLGAVLEFFFFFIEM